MSDEQTTAETWPDPDDVADWLRVLEGSVKLAEERLDLERSHLDRGRAAAHEATISPSPEASRRLSLLMHGEVINPSQDPEPPALSGSPWTPPTKEEREARTRFDRAQLAKRQVEEGRRRDVLSARWFGVEAPPQRFEGIVKSSYYSHLPPDRALAERQRVACLAEKHFGGSRVARWRKRAQKWLKMWWSRRWRWRRPDQWVRNFATTTTREVDRER